MKSCREITDSSSNISFKRQKLEHFDYLLDTATKKKLRSYLDAYYLKDDNPGEWLFLEIAFFELYSLRASPCYQDLKTLLSNRIYKKAEINLENFLLRLFFDKTTDPGLIIYLLQNNNDAAVISLSEAEMTIITEQLVKREVSFIVLLVKLVGCVVERTANPSCPFLKISSKYLDALEKITFLKQSLIGKIDLKSIRDAKDFFKIMQEVSENTIEPLNTLLYWETEIKRQSLHWIQDFFSKGTVVSSLVIDPICLNAYNQFHFFQLKTIDLSPSQVQYSAGVESNAYTKPF